MAENGYYWQIEGESATAENIDIVLSDLSDIVEQNTAEEHYDVVKFFPGTGGEKGHFGLGEGGSQVPPINAAENEIIVGDGNDWAEGNAAEVFLSTGTTYGGESCALFSSSGANGVNGFRLKGTDGEGGGTDFIITNNAVVEIGNKPIEPWEEGVMEMASFNDVEIFNPTFKIENAAQFKMSKNNDTQTPVFQMLGDAFFDMQYNNSDDYYDFSVTSYGANVRSGVRGSASLLGVNPFYYQKNDKYYYIDAPVFQMHDAATFSMVEKSLFQMKNGATSVIQGNANIHISGGEWTDTYHAPGVSDADKSTLIEVGPNSLISMGADDQFTDIIAVAGVRGDQIYLGSCNKEDLSNFSWPNRVMSVPSYGLSEKNTPEFNDGVKINSLYSGCFVPGTSLDVIRNEYVGTHESQPKFSLKGQCEYEERVDGGGIKCQHTSIGGQGFDFKETTVNGFSLEYDKVNSDARRFTQQEIVGEYSKLFNVAASSYFHETVDVHGATTLNFKPKTSFGVEYAGAKTNAVFQWEKIQGIFAGCDHFIQVDGNTHFESWSGTQIFRSSNPQLKEYTNNEFAEPQIPKSEQRWFTSGTFKICSENSALNNNASSYNELLTTQRNELTRAIYKSENTNNWYDFLANNNDYQYTSCQPIKYTKYTYTTKSCIARQDYVYVTTENFDNANQVFSSTAFKNIISSVGHYNPQVKLDTTFEKEYDINTGLYTYTITKATEYYAKERTTSQSCIEYKSKGQSATFPSYSYYYRNASDKQKAFLDSQIDKSLLVSQVNLNIVTNNLNSVGTVIDYEFPGGGNPSTRVEYAQKAEKLKVNIKTRQDGRIKCHIPFTGKTYSTLSDILNDANFKAYITACFGDEAQLITTDSTYFSCERDYISGEAKVDISNVGLETTMYLYREYISEDEKNYNYPNTTYGSLDYNNPVKLAIRDYLWPDKGYVKQGTYDYTNFTPDNTLTTTTTYTDSGYTYEVAGNVSSTYCASHLSQDWHAPIQTANRIGANDWEQGPIIQAYGPVNFLMREKWEADNDHTKTYPLTSSETYDVLNQAQAIADFKANATDYTAFETYLTQEGYTLWDIISIATATGGYTITFSICEAGWKPHVDSYPDNPVVEITDGSELRLYGGVKVKGETKYGVTTFTFSGTQTEGEVSFTLDELRSLKALIGI